MFDPYRKWLGIPDGERPPTHYQLLGISPDERDEDVIKAAVVRQSAYVRNFQVGKYSAEATRLLNEIGEAKVCLLDPVRRSRYDAELRARQPATAKFAPMAAPPAAPPSRPSATNRPATGMYGPDLAGSQLPGAGISASPSRALGPVPTSPLRPPAARAPAARPAAYDPPPLERDPLWATLQRAARSGPAAPSPVLSSGRSSAALPVWLWCLPLVTGTVLAVTLVVHFARPKRQVAQTAASGASETIATSDARVSTASSPAATAGFGQNSGGTSSPPTDNATNGNPYGTPANPPPASAPPWGGSPNAGGSTSGAPGSGGRTGSPLGSGGSSGNGPPTSPLQPPANVPPPYGFQPRNPSAPSAVTPGGQGIASGRPVSSNPARTLPAARPAWDGESTFSIPCKQTDHAPVYAQAHGPFVAIGRQVYSLADGTIVGETSGEFGSRQLRALSADGKYWASGDGDGVEVCRTDNGEVVSELGGKHAGVQLLFLAFGGPEKLFTITRSKGAHYLQSWDLASKKLRKDMMLEGFGRQTTLSDDGRFLATHDFSSGVLVYDIQKSPSKGRAKVAARIALDEPRTGGLSLLDGLQFSRDGAELVALYDRGERLTGWTTSGKILFDDTKGFFHDWPWTFDSAAVEYEPTGRGWLLWDKLFVDRQQRRLTWLLDNDSTPGVHDSRHRFIGDDRLAVIVGAWNSGELVDVKIPWRKIEESLVARENRDVAAWLGPHHPVSLKIELGQTLGDLSTQEIGRDLSGLLIDRLAADDINVLPGQPAVLAIQYDEKSTTDQTITTPLPQGGALARQVRGGTFASGSLTLYIDGSPQPFWTARFSVSAKLDEAASARSALYAALGAELARTAIPYFVSKDEDVLLSLPVAIRP
jgi:hypothetical protein